MSEATLKVGAQQEQSANLEAEKKQALARATEALGKAESAMGTGTTAFSAGHLLAGNWAAEHVLIRVSPPLSHSRAAAVQAVEKTLSPLSPVPVRGNDLIAAFQAFRLFTGQDEP